MSVTGMVQGSVIGQLRVLSFVDTDPRVVVCYVEATKASLVSATATNDCGILQAIGLSNVMLK